MTVIFEDDWVTLHHGDYREHLDGLHADAVITDPPYGETQLEWDRWVPGWVNDVSAIANSLWSFGSFRMFHEHASDFATWKYAQEIVWEKQNGTGLLRDRFRRVHEFAVQSYRGDWASIYSAEPLTDADVAPRTIRKRSAKGKHLHGAQASSSYTTETGGTKLIRSVMQVRSEHGRNPIHETQKPLGILLPLITTSVPPGGLVVDPFAGSASTAVAARMLGRRCIAFEVREGAAHKAAQRLASELVFAEEAS